MDEQNNDIEKIIQDIGIIRKAYDKIFTYGSMLKKITNQDLECMGYLVYYENMDLIEDAAYMIGQSITNVGAKPTDEGHKLSLDEIQKEKGGTIIGIWHYHADNNPESSTIDKKFMDLIFAEIKYVERSKKVPNFEVTEKDGATTIDIQNMINPAERVVVQLNGIYLDLDLKVYVQEGFKINFGVSIIADKHSQYTHEFFYQKWHPFVKKFLPTNTRSLPELKIIDSDPLNELEMLEEVISRTYLKGELLKEDPTFNKNYLDLKKEYSIKQENKKPELAFSIDMPEEKLKEKVENSKELYLEVFGKLNNATPSELGAYLPKLDETIEELGFSKLDKRNLAYKSNLNRMINRLELLRSNLRDILEE